MSYMKINNIEKIIFITLDSVRADRLSILGYHKDTTQYLRSMCRNVNCLAVIARANAPYTKASFKSIMTGLYPFSIKSYHDVRGLPKISTYIKRAGFKGMGIPNIDVLAGYGYEEDFDIFLGRLNNSRILRTIIESKAVKKPLARLPPKLRRISGAITYSSMKKGFNANPCVPITALINAIADFISRPGKRFLWVHIMDTHYPYMFDNDVFYDLHGYRVSSFRYSESIVILYDWLIYGGELSKEHVKLLIDMQEAAVATVDKYLHELIKKLGDTLGKTLIIITADHGEEYLEHGAYGHVGRRYLTHMFEELLRIPFIILDFTDSLPLNWIRKKLTYDSIMQVDILPTICEIIGIKCGTTDGESLFTMENTFLQQRKLVAEASLFNAGRGTGMLKRNEKIIVSIRKSSKKVIIYDKYFATIYNLDNDLNEKKPLILHFHDLNNTDASEDTRDLINNGLKRIQYAKKVILRDHIRHKIKYIHLKQ